MTEFRKPIVTLRQAWIAWLMVLVMVLAWVGGGGPSRAPMFTGPLAALSPAMAQDEAATLSAPWKVQRPSEFRPGHDPDDITLASGSVQVPQSVGFEGAREEAAQRSAALAPGLPQPRAPPLA